MDSFFLSPKNLNWLYERLNRSYGNQNWWPAQTRFEMMVGAILVQNTAWTHVEKAIDNLQACGWLDPQILHDLPEAEVAEAIRPSGYFNIKAHRLKCLCDWLLEQGGLVALDRLATPELRTALLSVRGVGPETADCILVYAFNRPVFVVDAYTRRILQRLGWLNADPGYEQLRSVLERTQPQDAVHLGQYHALFVEHAKQHCRASPVCGTCVLRQRCNYTGKPDA